MITRTVFGLIRSWRAIWLRPIPSWCSRNTALRLSASIMQFPHHFQKHSRLTQDSGRQQMRLRQERTGRQAPVFALAHDALHVLVRDLQVLQQHPFKLGRAVRVLGHLSHPVQYQRRMSFADRFAKRCRPAKISMGQLFNLAHTELFSAEGHDKVFDVLFLHPVHAHELPQGVHVGIDGKAATEDPLAHERDRKSTRLNSSHGYISYAVFCLKKKKKLTNNNTYDVTYIYYILRHL